MHNCLFLVSSSIMNVMATLVTLDNRTLHTITVTCTSDPNSLPDQCVVMAIPNDGGNTLTGM